VLTPGDGETYLLTIVCVDEATLAGLPMGYTWGVAQDNRYVCWLGDGKWEVREEPR
jgi:hypothetical protein